MAGIASTSEPAPQVATWQEVAYRCPRPGFFLGEDGASCALNNECVLLKDAEPTANQNQDRILPASWDLGRLGVLPLELLHQIVDELAESDVRALVALRNCNRAAAAVVGSFRDFATVASFPRALGALVRLAPEGGSASRTAPVSLRALAACLRSSACASCLREQRRQNLNENESTEPQHPDDAPYGDYIYLLAPERICYNCFRSKPEYMPVARFAGPAASSSSQAAQSGLPQTSSRPLTSIRVPPGRYGILARLTQPVDLFDRRQVYAEEKDDEVESGGGASNNAASSTATAGNTIHAERLHPDPAKRGPPVVRAKASRPDPLRYAAVIPGPYWEEPEDGSSEAKILDRGYACRACAQTEGSTGAAAGGRHAGWADPLVRYTQLGLQRHIADPQLGGRVLRRPHPRHPGVDVFEHDAPRRGHFPPPAEFGATADLARRYEAVVLVPTEAAVAGTRR